MKSAEFQVNSVKSVKKLGISVENLDPGFPIQPNMQYIYIYIYRMTQKFLPKEKINSCMNETWNYRTEKKSEGFGI